MSLAGFDLNLLKVFEALMREGSTTRAGHRLGLSQPAVSAALGRLRQSLGDELFLRQGQGLTPTERAMALEEPVRALLAGMEQVIRQHPGWTPTTATDVLKLSGIDFFGEMLMPALSRRLSTEAPGLRVQMVDLVPDASVEMLDLHHIDLALMPRIDTPGWVESRDLFRAPFVVVARTDHPRLARAGLAEGDEVPLDLYCDLHHILCSPDGRLSAMGDAALAKLGRRRHVAMSVPFFSTVAGIVGSSDLVSLIPAQFARAVAPRYGLSLYAPPIPPPSPVIAMFWHRRASAAPAHRWLREAVAAILVPLNDGLPP